jgi:hypothetical protein
MCTVVEFDFVVCSYEQTQNVSYSRIAPWSHGHPLSGNNADNAPVASFHIFSKRFVCSACGKSLWFAFSWPRYCSSPTGYVGVVRDLTVCDIPLRNSLSPQKKKWEMFFTTGTCAHTHGAGRQNRCETIQGLWCHVFRVCMWSLLVYRGMVSL